jgi:hypothetical protein
MFLNAGLAHLYVAIGDPGVIDVFDSRALEPLDMVATERGLIPSPASRPPQGVCLSAADPSRRGLCWPHTCARDRQNARSHALCGRQTSLCRAPSGGESC